MIYTVSDLHGAAPDDLERLLDRAGFSDADWLYVLGDVIDRRGDGGVGLLLRLTEMTNAQLILGNHEAMLLSCDFVFDEITEESVENLDEDKMSRLSNYMYNGGGVTLQSLKKLMRADPQTFSGLLEYLREAPLYETVTAGGRDFVLVHAGLGNFSADKRLCDYAPDELLWERPDPADRYFEDALTVLGHTPTLFYGEEHKGSIFKTDTWIDIDVGAAGNYPPALLRLDDLNEFYL